MKHHLKIICDNVRIFYFLFFFLVFHSISIYSTDYYVSFNSGNDANNGLSPTSPWKTLSKVNSFAFSPGDNIYLERGNIWRETLTLNSSKSGTSTSYIKVSAYGNGKLPQINGANLISGSWSNLGNNLWSITLTTDPLNVLFFGKSDTTHWGLKQTSASNCNADFKWYWSSNTLYVYAGADPGNYYQWIQYPIRGSSISKQYIWLDNLDFAYGGRDGGQDYNLRTNNAHYMKITNCEFRYSGADNIYFLSSYAIISNNKIYESIVHGIYCGAYNPYIVNDNVIEHNEFWNNYYNEIDLMNVNQPYSGGHIVRYNKAFKTKDIYSNASSACLSIIGKNSNTKLSNVMVYGNLFYNTTGTGILISDYDDSLYIYNNTICGVATHSITFSEFGIPSYSWVINNIMYSPKTFFIAFGTDDHKNKVIDFNNYFKHSTPYFYIQGATISNFTSWQNLGYDVNSFFTDPLFIDEANQEYLLSSLSSMINKGTNLVNTPPYSYTKDFRGTSVPQQGITDIGAYEYVDDRVTDNIPPNLLSASLINSTTIELTFSEALESSSALNRLNYSINNGIVVNSVTLSADAKKVTLSTSQHTANVSYTVVVTNVKDLAGNTISTTNNSTVYSYVVVDTTPPGLLSAAAINSTTVDLFFSEELESASAQTKTNYLINNGITVNTASLSTDKKKVTLSTTPHITNQSYTVAASNVKDLAGNVISSNNSVPYTFIDNTIGNLKANVKIFLQGPADNNVMMTELSGNGLMPTSQPYNTAPWNYNGNESSNLSSGYVDWILVELRSSQNPAQVISRRAALLRSDGRIAETNGTIGITFNNLMYGSYYIAIFHRNHLAVMTSAPVLFSPENVLYDFTNSLSKSYGQDAMAQISSGIYGMYAGDGNGDGRITIADHNDVWLPQNGSFGYLNGDFNLDGGTTIHDVNLYFNTNNGKMTQVP